MSLLRWGCSGQPELLQQEPLNRITASSALFWYSGSQEKRTGCCYKINASCFENTANVLALPVFIFVKGAHLCPSFNLAAGAHYPLPTSYSVDIISQPFWTSMHPGGCMLCVMFCPSNLGRAQTQTCASLACTLLIFLAVPARNKYLFFICLLCKHICLIYAVCTAHTHNRKQIRKKGDQKKGERSLHSSEDDNFFCSTFW